MAIFVGSELFVTSYGSMGGYTYVYNYGASNGTGILDTVKISIVKTGVTGLVIGVTPVTASPNYCARDFVSIGSLTAGDQTIIGVSIDVETDDVLMIYNFSGDWGYSIKKSSYFIYGTGNLIDGLSHSFTVDTGNFIAISLNATGTETPSSSPSAGARKASNIFQRGL